MKLRQQTYMRQQLVQRLPAGSPATQLATHLALLPSLLIEWSTIGVARLGKYPYAKAMQSSTISAA
jgi:hypothetical protein